MWTLLFMRSTVRTCGLILCILASISCTRDTDIEIYSLHITSDIKLRYATTLVTSRVANKNLETDREVEFDVTLPNQAMITNFSMEIDGKIYPGQLKEKEAAQKQYNEAKRKGQSAGQIKARPRETNKFSVSVNVAAQSKVTFNLTYQELLERKKGLYEHIIYIDPGQTVADLRVNIGISESRPITRLVVPTISTELLTNNVDLTGTNQDVVIGRPSSSSADIQYRPSVSQQRGMGEAGISGLFRVFYDVERAQGGEVLVVDGYFVHFFAPEGLEPVGKNVLFILDVSSSMTGQKIQQLKDAMKKILKDLSNDDTFCIAEFSTAMKFWKHGFIPGIDENIAKATQYINKIRARGWTNINSALSEGINGLRNLNDGRASIILFLTDGEPTQGVTDPTKILSNVGGINEGAQIFSLAFGDGADYDFVKKLAAQNYGVARKIYEHGDAALQISGFYEDISTALMQDVSFKYIGDEVESDSITKSEAKSYFEGSELIISGKLSDRDSSSFTTEISGITSEGGIKLTIEPDMIDTAQIAGHSYDLTKLEDLSTITQRIWGYLSIKQLEEKLLLDITAEEKASIEKEILEKALRFHFVTKYTSMVVTKPEKKPELPTSVDSPTPDLKDYLDASLASDASLSVASDVPKKSHGVSAGRHYAGGGKTHNLFHGHQLKRHRVPVGLDGRHYASRRKTIIQPNKFHGFVPPPSYDGAASSPMGLAGRQYAGGGDPHFEVWIPGVVEPFCFDVNMKSSDTVHLLSDKDNAVSISAKIIGGKKFNKKDIQKTYIEEIVITYKGRRASIATDTVRMDSVSFLWQTRRRFGVEIVLSEDGNALEVKIGNVLKLLIRRFVHTNGHVDYLNFVLTDGKGLNRNVGGLIGQFSNKSVKLKRHHYMKKTKKTRGVFILRSTTSKNRIFKADLKMKKKDVTDQQPEMCWMIHKPGKRFLDRSIKHYLIDVSMH